MHRDATLRCHGRTGNKQDRRLRKPQRTSARFTKAAARARGSRKFYPHCRQGSLPPVRPRRHRPTGVQPPWLQLSCRIVRMPLQALLARPTGHLQASCAPPPATMGAPRSPYRETLPRFCHDFFTTSGDSASKKTLPRDRAFQRHRWKRQNAPRRLAIRRPPSPTAGRCARSTAGSQGPPRRPDQPPAHRSTAPRVDSTRAFRA